MVDADITLRDRIAAVQRNHAALTPDDLQRWQEQRCLCGHLVVGDDLEQIVSKWADHVAAAVIEALNLKIAVDYMSADRQRRNFMLAGNYTTEKQ